MRRSERVRRLPTRFSSSILNSKCSSSQKPITSARYSSRNVKTVSHVKTAGVEMSAPPVETLSASLQNQGQSFSFLSKYTRSVDSSIAEIFGASPDNGNDGVAAKTSVKEMKVAGDMELSKKLSHLIQTGPLEAEEAPQLTKSAMESVLANRFGIPDMGFADLISQTAVLPQTAFPANSNDFIEASAHPCNSRMNRLLTPQKRKLIQQHLILLLHAYKCERAHLTKLPCPVPFCLVMKKVQIHMKACRDGYNCNAPFCSSSRRIMCHWKHCKVLDCVVCCRLRTILLFKKKQIDLEKKEQVLMNLHLNKPHDQVATVGFSSPPKKLINMLPVVNNISL